MQIRDTATDDGYFAAPASLDPLPETLRHALIALALVGTVSAICTLGLVLFVLQRVISWRQHIYNQYIMLVLNLLIADMQQAAAFLISWKWIAIGKIVAPTSACFAQGWLLHSGDVSSGMFVLAIAVHTFWTAVLGKKITHSVFYSAILFLWVFSYILTAIGVGLHPQNYFVRAGAWCWVNAEYQHERLLLHYLWIFIVQFTTVLIYAVTFFALRYKTKVMLKNYRELRDAPNPRTIQAVTRVTRLMTLYPCVYILLTLPLSAGRMWSMARDGALTSDAFSIAAGTLLASCGWVDALLYTLTRKRLLEDTTPGRKRAEANTIIASKHITVQHHGDLPKEGRATRGLFDNAHRLHEESGMPPGDVRYSGPLIESPTSSMYGDPELEGNTESRTVSHDWEISRRPISMGSMRAKMPWD